MVLLRVTGVDEGTVVAQRRHRGVGADLPVQLEHRRTRGVHGGGEEAVAESLRVTGADVPHGLETRRRLDSIRGSDRDRREVVLRGDRVVGVVPDLVDGAPERRGDSRGEDGDERHERKTDHQRRGSRCGALRVPPSVVLRERSRRTAEAPRGPAEGAGERPDEAHREYRDADEDQQRTEAHPQQHGGGAEVLAEQAVEQRGKAEQCEAGRAERAEPREARLRQCCALANRGDRLHARRTDCGPEAGDQRHQDADEQRDDHRPASQTRGRCSGV